MNAARRKTLRDLSEQRRLVAQARVVVTDTVKHRLAYGSWTDRGLHVTIRLPVWWWLSLGTRQLWVRRKIVRALAAAGLGQHVASVWVV